MSQFFLVTGGSGYIAIHVINQLVRKGYKVRTTVRNLKNNEKCEPIKKLNKFAKFPIEIVQADLLDARSWNNALKDITHVMHVASPLLLNEPKNEDLEYIQPAVQGTLNILQACSLPNSTIERVVITSSGLCIFGSEYENKTYSEADWADFDKLKTGYIRSKLLAEEAAWKFVKNKKDANQACFDLAAVHPVLVLGPLLHSSLGTSATRFLNIFANKLDKIPDLYYPTCDVRDVALAHVQAALLPEAINNRHLIVSSTEFIPMTQWAEILNEEFSQKGFKIPTELDENQENVPMGKNSKINDYRMRGVLKITPTDFKSTILDMAYSFIQNGIVKPKF